MPDRNPLPVTFTHLGETLQGVILHNPSVFGNIVLVRLHEVHQDLHAVIVLHKEGSEWVSDEFGERYPETIRQLDRIIRATLLGI
ncbi:hypothetical protein I5907_19355 [Panacibacter sp. DH6]|uniref:Uncharacterized protein n=1 Tax=Panacibacter microcysteis TaxID=2793269 RepID=A0A931GZU0_9BACT|nr:hypothetical protein [Panacibacter microcysteis]MBG9378404.1 hypothetical protein [Panacibacter microcysteis]